MKKRSILFVIAALAVFGGAAFLYYNYGEISGGSFSPNPAFSEELKTITFGDTVIRVAVADSTRERTLGLSGTTELPEGTGMLFIFQSENIPSFWMKDMLFPIDIIWISSAGVVVGVVPNATPESYPSLFRPDEPILYVLEVNAGFATQHDVQKGSEISVEMAL
jgi:uncharacterized membrane protein (UPF0127 family)